MKSNYWLCIGKNKDLRWQVKVIYAKNPENLVQHLEKNAFWVHLIYPFFPPLFYSKRKRKKQLHMFFEQLLILHQIHLPLTKSLQMLLTGPIASLPKFVLKPIVSDLLHGLPFQQALKHHPFFFDPLSITLIEMSLKSGHFFHGLQVFNQHYQYLDNMRQKIYQQIFYPALLLVLTMLFLIFFIQNIIPKYQSLFAQFQTPFPCQLETLFQPLHILGFAGFLVLLFQFRNHLPWIKTLKNNFDWLTWAHLVRIGLESGLSLYQSLELTQGQTLSSDLQKWNQRLIYQLRLGHPLSTTLAEHKNISPLMRQYLHLLEYQGESALLLKQCCQYLQMELNKKILIIEKYLQPLLLGMISIFMAWILLILSQPILELGKMI